VGHGQKQGRGVRAGAEAEGVRAGAGVHPAGG
jgi:hypothetical protein